MASHLVQLNDATFSDWTENTVEATLVCVGAGWCSNSQELKPILEDLSAEYAGKARIAMVDFDESPEFVKKHGISAVPTLLMFKLGECDELVSPACQIEAKAARSTMEELIRRVM